MRADKETAAAFADKKVDKDVTDEQFDKLIAVISSGFLAVTASLNQLVEKVDALHELVDGIDTRLSQLHDEGDEGYDIEPN